MNRESRPKRITIPDTEFQDPSVSCDQCGELCLFSRDEGGNVIRLNPESKIMGILAHKDGEQYAYRVRVYEWHFCRWVRS